MIYSKATLIKLLHKMQSLDYPTYGNWDEVDVLIDLLKHEYIINYAEVEWKAFWPYLYEEQHALLPGVIDDEYSITVGNRLEAFCDRIIGKAETVRLLTYFRDHAAESVFKGDKVDNMPDFEKECSRLIWVYMHERRQDEYHGRFASMAHPDLNQIALGDEVVPKIETEEDAIIAKNLPSYPHDMHAFSAAVIIKVAHHFVDMFRAQRDRFKTLGGKEEAPNMSRAAYKEPIRNELIRTANRMLIWEDDPIYQVMWVMMVLMKLPRQREWYEDKFVDGLDDYLNMTMYFKNLLPLANKTVSAIRQLTEPSLDFGFGDEEPSCTDVRPVQNMPPHLSRNQLIEQLAADLRNKEKNPQIIIAEHLTIETNNAPINNFENSHVTYH